MVLHSQFGHFFTACESERLHRRHVWCEHIVILHGYIVQTIMHISLIYLLSFYMVILSHSPLEMREGLV